MSYEAQGIFYPGFTKAEVEAIQTKAKAVYIEEGGSQIVSWSSSGHQASSRISLTADQVLIECQYALQFLDPDNYPPDIDRTTVEFSNADEASSS